MNRSNSGLPENQSSLSRRVMLAAIPVAAIGFGAVLPAAAETVASPDARLLELGRQFEAAWVQQNRADDLCEETLSEEAYALIEAAVDATSAIVHKIDEFQAHTLAGLYVKARAVSWCHSGEEMHADSLAFDRATTDLRLAAMIVRDILAIGGANV